MGPIPNQGVMERLRPVSARTTPVMNTITLNGAVKKTNHGSAPTPSDSLLPPTKGNNINARRNGEIAKTGAASMTRHPVRLVWPADLDGGGGGGGKSLTSDDIAWDHRTICIIDCLRNLPCNPYKEELEGEPTV